MRASTASTTSTGGTCLEPVRAASSRAERPTRAGAASTSGNGWIGIGTATGAHAPRHRAIPIAVARGFTRAIVSSGAFPGNGSRQEPEGAARGGPSPSGHDPNHATAESRYRDPLFIESAGAIFLAIICPLDFVLSLTFTCP